MIIRFLTGNDIKEHDKVSSQAFVASCDIDDPCSVLPCEKVLGAFDDDNRTLFAELEIHDKKCSYDGGILTCAGVGGVAAKPEHRGKGAVIALFDRMFAMPGYDVSVLYPFAEEYYRKLGYERVGRSLCAKVPFSRLSHIKRNQDAKLFEGGDEGRLLDIYNACARQYNLSFVRENTEAFSDRPYLSENYTYIFKDSSLATIRVDRAQSAVFVKEIWFASRESMLGIVGFLRNFESNQKYVCFENIPESSPLIDFVRDLKDCEITLRSTGSARLLNIENVFRAHRYPSGEGEFTVGIGDEVFHVKYSENGVYTDKNAPGGPEAVMDIGTASRILLSGMSDPEYVPGLKIIDPGSDFLRAFPPKTAFFTDSL